MLSVQKAVETSARHVELLTHVWSVTCVTPVTLARTDALTYVDVYSAPQLTRFGA